MGLGVEEPIVYRQVEDLAPPPVGPVLHHLLMGMRFSERHGLVPVRSAVQVEGMDAPLRTHLWNFVYENFLEQQYSESGSEFVAFYPIWTDLMKGDRDEFPGYGIVHVIKDWIKNAKWHQVYDFVEDLAQLSRGAVDDHLNAILEQHLAGYRIVNRLVVPIADSHELSEIEGALTVDSDAVAHHLQNALNHLADRERPDYPNSIKESISAVEAFLAPVTGKNTLGTALVHLKKNSSFAHPALLEAWSKLYGWTSDENGIRHGGEKVPAEFITQALARYVLISCSAFINLMIAEQAAGRIPLTA